MLAKLLLKARAKVTAGFAKDVEDVKKYAPAIQVGTTQCNVCGLLLYIAIIIASSNPAVAIISLKKLTAPALETLEVSMIG